MLTTAGYAAPAGFDYVFLRDGAHTQQVMLVLSSLPQCATYAPPPAYPMFVVARHQVMKNEGIECLEGEVLLVKLQNASCEGLHGEVCRLHVPQKYSLAW